MSHFLISAYRGISAIGGGAITLVVGTGRILLFFFSILWQSVRWPLYIQQIRKHLFSMGYGSLALVGLTALFTGMVLALQTYTSFAHINAENALPEVVAMSLVRELGPVLSGLMMAGRLGAAIAAEIATMRVTDQIDALVTLSTNPVRYLIVPRVISTVIILPLLTLVADIIGIFGGYCVAVYRFHLHAAQYLGNTMHVMQWSDVSSGLIKAVAFGFIVGFVGCYEGYYSPKGAMGVGKATTNGVVASSICILAANYLLTSLLFSR